MSPSVEEAMTVSEKDSLPNAKSEPQVDEEKRSRIDEACGKRDLGKLRDLAATAGGFLTDSLRRKAWPILLGLQASADGEDNSGEETGPNQPDWKSLPKHDDEDQVQLDVQRSFIYYPNDESEKTIDSRKAQLSSLITEVLRRNDWLCYFQGYHDICQVFLLVLGPTASPQAVARLSALRIRDFMLSSLVATTAQLQLLPDIISQADPKLRKHLTGVEPFYALPGTLTMYAHNIEGYQDIARLFDVLLSLEPAFSIYMFAQIVIRRRDEILEIDEPDMMHVVLGKVPTMMDLDSLITESIELFHRYPLNKLRSWNRISSASVLKTARDLRICSTQSIDDGHIWFQQQSQEIRWAEIQQRVQATMWAYRKPARGLAMAVVVATAAVYLRRNPALANAVFGKVMRSVQSFL